MRLRPDETRIDDPALIQPSQFLQTQSEQFSRFKCSHDPLRGRRVPAIAVAAHVEDAIALDALGDVDGGFETVAAEGSGCLCAVYCSAAVIAEDCCGG